MFHIMKDFAMEMLNIHCMFSFDIEWKVIWLGFILYFIHKIDLKVYFQM